jgi:endonuclease/exonuclease/phosphatase (EEP) superfamily protein YafD
MVGRLAAREREPTIVAGDMNDVAWSHTTRLFQRVSRTLDPRRGRGMFNTFHARWFFMRWPLDHLFHSEHFRLVRLRRGAAFGSDHFPMVVELELDPAARHEQEPPERSADDEREADEKKWRGTREASPEA